MTLRAFVTGHPIAHSRSPLIHGHWLAEHGIDGSYEAIDTAPEDLPALVERVRSGAFVGGNVTVPHKQQAFALIDTASVEANIVGAVNTLSVSDAVPDRLVHGENTDVEGFLANLDESAPGWSENLGSAVVLGAGGAARAILLALAPHARGGVHVLNRTVATAETLVAEMNADLGGVLRAGALADFPKLAPGAGLVVNTTTVGMHGTRFDGLALDKLPKSAIVTDAVYTPLETPLLAEARALGLRTVDGLGMLLHQAVPGFERWFGVRPEVTPALRRKVLESLEK